MDLNIRQKVGDIMDTKKDQSDKLNDNEEKGSEDQSPSDHDQRSEHVSVSEVFDSEANESESTNGALGNSKETKKEESGLYRELIEWMKAIVIAIVLVFLIRSFLFSPFIVDGRSMLPNFESNERVIVNLLVYDLFEPKFGDVVVFDVPEQDRRFIKRIIGLPGDRVRLEGDQLYINDQLVEESYLKKVIEQSKSNNGTYNGEGGRFNFPNDLIDETIVPEGHYFVLGDNRSDSTDSRMIGFIDESEIIGRADMIIWPMDKIKIIKHPN